MFRELRMLLLSIGVAGSMFSEIAQAGDIGNPHSTELHSALDTLLHVREQGLDDVKAREAWRVVARADAVQLTTVLAALDGAGPLSANWIRSAADTIASRSLPHGSPELLLSLKRFVLDAGHAPRARRMAYEWLARFDPSGAEKLVPDFLNDPSTELRRDAVDRLIKQADELFAESKRNGETVDPAQRAAALALYRQAMSAARDLDQVDELAKLLKEFGDKVDLPKHFGFITTWHLIGPFDNRGGKGLQTAYPPEKTIDLKASYPGKTGAVKWFTQSTDDPYGMLDLNKAIGKEHGVVAYAMAEFDAERERAVEVRLGCITACKLWLNGQYLAGQQAYHAGTKIDQFIGRGVLHSGRNVILLKVCQNEQTEAWAQNWQFQLRVCDAAGTAIASSTRGAP